MARRCREGAFETLVRVLNEEHSLHPLLPLSAGAVRHVARTLEIDAGAARELVTWLRLGSLLQARKSKELSDLSLKNLVVVPAHGSDPVTTRAVAEEALEQAHLALQEVAALEPHLNTFTARYPDVRLSASAFALVLPMPLYEVFVSLDFDQRATFLTRLQIGRVSLARFLGKVRSAAAEIPERVWPGVCFLRARTKKPGQRKIREIRPAEISPESLRTRLEEALIDERGAVLRALAVELNRIMSDDRADVVRGLWSGA